MFNDLNLYLAHHGSIISFLQVYGSEKECYIIIHEYVVSTGKPRVWRVPTEKPSRVLLYISHLFSKDTDCRKRRQKTGLAGTEQRLDGLACSAPVLEEK